MKKYLIFAGVNGAGKTTLYQANSEYQNLPRVNMDEIVRTFGSWKNSADVFQAGKIASFIQGELKDCAEDVPQWCSGLLRISGWPNAYSRLPFPVRLPAAKPVNAAELTEEELNMELEKGYEDKLAGNVKSAWQAFADIREDCGL